MQDINAFAEFNELKVASTYSFQLIGTIVYNKV